MDNKDAHEQILKDADEISAEYDCINMSAIRNENDIDYYVKRIVGANWMRQHPEHFYNCYVTTDEYKNNSNVGYAFYMTVMNGTFRCDKWGVTGKHKQMLLYMESGKQKYFDMIACIFESAKNADDIIAWCIDNFNAKM